MIVAVPTETPVIACPATDATAGLEDVNAHTPLEFEVGEVIEMALSAVVIAIGANAPNVGRVPNTCIENVVEPLNQ